MRNTALFALVAASTLATAQDLSIAPVVYVMDGWTITSILDDTDSVHSLLITRETPAPDPAHNVTGVLAVRDVNGWQASAWIGESTESILQWMHEELALPDPLHPDIPWPIDGLNFADPIVIASEPVPFGKGIIASHPLADAIEAMEDPSTLLGLLEAIGQPAASGTITAGGSPIGGGGTQPSDPPSQVCPLRTTEEYWNAITASVEAYFIDPALVNTVFDETIDPLPPGNQRFCCRPRTVIIGPTNWGPWDCTGPWRVIREEVSTDGCYVYGTYRQTISRQRTRICSFIYPNCTVSGPFNQTQTQTAERSGYGFWARNNNGCDGASFVLPATPPNASPCGPDAGYTGQSNWPLLCL